MVSAQHHLAMVFQKSHSNQINPFLQLLCINRTLTMQLSCTPSRQHPHSEPTAPQHANPSPVQHQTGQPPHLGSGQPQQNLYHTATLTATPPSLTPGPSAHPPRAVTRSRQCMPFMPTSSYPTDIPTCHTWHRLMYRLE
ncbi:hypothetical protein GDO86_018222 [Hymenochirus boettgeri]|uniref:Uncharacterized protein n=1 Tax=Hymenochirus boettgeri TaxID=247094 RepID=A0A8T2ILN6_9PIPI|nr:hypothetical protein GDO86_018222 [Hymenochirus boettgeri]